jgi:hypothetical protein
VPVSDIAVMLSSYDLTMTLCLGLSVPVSDIAAMLTSPDPGATVGAKAIAAVGKMLFTLFKKCGFNAGSD